MSSSVPREIALIAYYELKAMLLSVRMVLFVLGYGTVAYVAGAAYVGISRKIMETMSAQGVDDTQRVALYEQMKTSPEFKEKVGPALEWLGGPHLYDALMGGNLPWIVAFVLLFSSFIVPALVLVVGFDRISEDRQSKFSRYVFLRVRRESYLLGKILGQWGAVLAAVIVVHVALLLRGMSLPEAEVTRVLPSLPMIWGGISLFVLAYVTYVNAVGAHVGPPFATLAVGLAALIGLWISSFGEIGHAVWMGTWDMRLWVMDPAAYGVFAAHIVVFGAIAWFGVARRDA